MQRRYGDTPIGRQELEGEIVEERMTGLWKRAGSPRAASPRAPSCSRIVVAVDPPVSSNAGSDSCGIIVAGLGVDNRGYVIGDRTIQGRDPATWAKAAVAAYHDYQADTIVVETNQGGDLVVQAFKSIDAAVPVKKVHASRGKYLRAEPVSALYNEGRVAHVGEFPELERQMCDFAADGLANGKSPDRLDALVWALTELMLTTTRTPACTACDGERQARRTLRLPEAEAERRGWAGSADRATSDSWPSRWTHQVGMPVTCQHHPTGLPSTSRRLAVIARRWRASPSTHRSALRASALATRSFSHAPHAQSLSIAHSRRRALADPSPRALEARSPCAKVGQRHAHPPPKPARTGPLHRLRAPAPAGVDAARLRRLRPRRLRPERHRLPLPCA